MVLRQYFEDILSNFIDNAYVIDGLETNEEKAIALMIAIIDITENILDIKPKTDYSRIQNNFTEIKRVLRNYAGSYIPQNATQKSIIKQFTSENTNLRDNTIKSIIFNYLVRNPNIYNLAELEIEGRQVRTYDEAMMVEEMMDEEQVEQADVSKEEPGMRDLFTNSELIQDNITQLNSLIEKINLELYNNLASGLLFSERRVNSKYTTVEDIEQDLLRLSDNDKKMISDKFDLIIDDLKDGDSANHYETVRNFFKLGIYPIKKVTVSDPNKPTKNANLITGTQNIYKVENTQNPFKISPYVNNDLGDYIVNGKKINIKLVGLNYIVKEGTKTKVFKNLSLARQFILNGGFDMYNNNKSKFISSKSKDFNNKKQPLRLSYSSNIF